jgi:hypothetical protein
MYSETSECAKQANVPKNRDYPRYPTKHRISQQHNMPQKSDERELTSAIQAIQKDPTLSLRAISRVYYIDHRKLARRLRGMQPRRDIIANSRKLTNLAAKGFPPQLSNVEDMANRLLIFEPRLSNRTQIHAVS